MPFINAPALLTYVSPLASAVPVRHIQHVGDLAPARMSVIVGRDQGLQVASMTDVVVSVPLAQAKPSRAICSSLAGAARCSKIVVSMRSMGQSCCNGMMKLLKAFECSVGRSAAMTQPDSKACAYCR